MPGVWVNAGRRAHRDPDERLTPVGCARVQELQDEVRARDPWYTSQALEACSGPQMRSAGERVPGRQDHDLRLRAQLLGVEPGRRVEGPVQQRHVGPPVVDQALLLADPALSTST